VVSRFAFGFVDYGLRNTGLIMGKDHAFCSIRAIPFWQAYIKHALCGSRSWMTWVADM